MIKYKNFAIQSIKFLVLAILIYVFIKYIFVLVFPFLLAYFFAHVFHCCVYFLSKEFGIPKKISAFFLVIFITLTILALMLIIFDRLFFEVSNLDGVFENLIKDIPGYIEKVKNFVYSNKYIKNYGFASELENGGLKISNLLTSFLSSLTPKITEFIGKIFSFIPYFIFCFVVFVISSIYFMCDIKKINIFFLSQFPLNIKLFMSKAKNQLYDVVFKYIKAYIILAVITFLELLCAFTLFKIEYAFIASFAITFIDILPVLGVGTVLIPMSLINYISGNTLLGTELIFLYIAMLIVRHICEPKIIGELTGLYPVVSLISVYIGFYLFGITGLFLLPAIIIVIKNLNESGFIHLYKNPQNLPCDELCETRKKYKKYKRGK